MKRAPLCFEQQTNFILICKSYSVFFSPPKYENHRYSIESDNKIYEKLYISDSNLKNLPEYRDTQLDLVKIWILGNHDYQ